jgi:hypothetical protein
MTFSHSKHLPSAVLQRVRSATDGALKKNARVKTGEAASHLQRPSATEKAMVCLPGHGCAGSEAPSLHPTAPQTPHSSEANFGCCCAAQSELSLGRWPWRLSCARLRLCPW